MQIKFLKANNPQPHPNNDEILRISSELSRPLTRLGVLLSETDTPEWMLEVMTDTRKSYGRFLWLPQHSVESRNPNHIKLTAEIFNILEHIYPSSMSLLMNGTISPNKMLAERIAQIVAEARREDLQDVETQLKNMISVLKKGA